MNAHTLAGLLARVDTEAKRARIAMEPGAMPEADCAAMTLHRCGTREAAEASLEKCRARCDRSGPAWGYYDRVILILRDAT